MRKVNLKNVVWKEGKYFVAWNLNTAISSFGRSRKEALESLQEALELHFEDTSIAQCHKVEYPDLVSSDLRYA
jgi:predicted RNase H-like HicB family nuclease